MEENKVLRSGNSLGELIESIGIAVILAVLIRAFLFQPFYIPSGSMEPTLMPGDRIIVSKLSYRLGRPKPGDIMVFKYPLDTSKDFIKRVVALEGDRVEGRNGRVLVNGQELKEPYLPPNLRSNDFGPIVVPPGSLFMMGDNRNNSQDSRFWGALPLKDVIGKAVLIFWPPGRVGGVR